MRADLGVVVNQNASTLQVWAGVPLAEGTPVGGRPPVNSAAEAYGRKKGQRRRNVRTHLPDLEETVSGGREKLTPETSHTLLRRVSRTPTCTKHSSHYCISPFPTLIFPRP